jgi:hypothetical protein
MGTQVWSKTLDTRRNRFEIRGFQALGKPFRMGGERKEISTPKRPRFDLTQPRGNPYPIRILGVVGLNRKSVTRSNASVETPWDEHRE